MRERARSAPVLGWFLIACACASRIESPDEPSLAPEHEETPESDEGEPTPKAATHAPALVDADTNERSSGDESAPVGAIPAEAIRAVVRAGVPDVRACMSEGAGLVEVGSFRILADGSVAEVEVRVQDDASSATRDAAACVRRVVGAWTFPAPNGGGTVIVSYPRFGPSG